MSHKWGLARDVTCSCAFVWHECAICASCAFVWHDCASAHLCDMTHIHMWYDSLTHVTQIWTNPSWGVTHVIVVSDIHSRRRPDLKHLDLQIRVVFLEILLSDEDSVYSRKTLFVIFGIPEKTCLICTGTPIKTCWKIGSRNYFKSDLLCLRICYGVATVSRIDKFIGLFCRIQSLL